MTMTMTRAETGIAQPAIEGSLRGAGRPFSLRVALIGMVAFLVVGNLAIAGASAWARSTAPAGRLQATGIGNFRVVDDRLWRGAAPSRDGYRWLAANGVRTVVDLRAETDINVDHDLLDALGVVHVALPIRDGQIPTADQVASFLDAAGRAPGTVFIHCGAGVGRTGAMVAAYLKATGTGDGLAAVRGNLAVGPPSVEQLAYAAGIDPGPGKPVLVAVSRTLDAPRRLWTRIRPY